MKHTVPTFGVATAAVAVVVVAAAAAALPGALATAVGADRGEPASDAPRAVEVAYQIDPAPTVYVFIPTPTPGPPTPTPRPRPRATPVPDTVANAKIYARNRLGATQYACLDRIFTYESRWNPLAGNPTSGAYGIPQALPGSKMSAFGANWRTSPLTQVKWGIWYVNDRYGSACTAWAHIEAYGWY